MGTHRKPVILHAWEGKGNSQPIGLCFGTDEVLAYVLDEDRQNDVAIRLLRRQERSAPMLGGCEDVPASLTWYQSCLRFVAASAACKEVKTEASSGLAAGGSAVASPASLRGKGASSGTEDCHEQGRSR